MTIRNDSKTMRHSPDDDDDDHHHAVEEEIVVEADKEFPIPFYDPTTDAVMKNPVVNAVGDSYDQTTVDSDGSASATSYYPNRALKAIIEREIELASGSLRSKFRRTGHSLQHGWGRLVEQSAFTFESKPLPPSFYCPIACEIIADPVLDPDGYSYERSAIINWLRNNQVSPMTRNSLRASDLRRNNALHDLIQQEKDRSDGSIHGSFRRWKDSGSATCRPLESQDHPDPSAPSASLQDRPDSSTQNVPESGDIETQSPRTQNYPTTFGELHARRRRQRRASVTAVGVVIVLFAIFVLAPYYMVGAIICLALLLLGWRRYAGQRGSN